MCHDIANAFNGKYDKRHQVKPAGSSTNMVPNGVKELHRALITDGNEQEQQMSAMHMTAESSSASQDDLSSATAHINSVHRLLALYA